MTHPVGGSGTHPTGGAGTGPQVRRPRPTRPRLSPPARLAASVWDLGPWLLRRITGRPA